MTLTLIGLPASMSLAIIATLGYMMSRRVSSVAAERNAARQDMKRTQAVIAQLAAISQQMRLSLAQHHSTVMEFKSRLDDYQKQQAGVSLQELSLEANRMIAPTEQLASSIAEAYEGIRQTQLFTASRTQIDSLTGVGDRKALTQNIDVLLKLRNKCEVPFALAMFDIDCFAAYNARAGRTAGNEVLCTMAGILDSRSRSSDQVCRLEKDRFVVILPGTDAAGAQVFIRRMLPYIDAGLPVACSTGVAEAKADDTCISMLGRCQQELQKSRISSKMNIRVHGEEGISRKSGLRVSEAVSEKIGR